MADGIPTCEYIDAQQNLERIDLRLTALEGRMADAEIVAARRDGVVEIGESVVVLDLENGEVSEYRIVGAGDATRPLALSYHSPVSRALLGRGRGDVVDVGAPVGRRRLEILGLDGYVPEMGGRPGKDEACGPWRHPSRGTIL